MKYYRTLINCTDLAGERHRGAWSVIDCRYQLTDPQAGQSEYQRGHIPGACYAHLGRDLSAAGPATLGRHPLPDPERLAARLASWGIGSDTQMVVYDDAGGAMAARLWWLARWLGHDRVAVLDGGWQQWTARKLPVETHISTPPPGEFVGRADPRGLASAEELLLAHILVLDARGEKRFTGEQEPMDERAGHIPGARNYPYANNLDKTGCFHPAQKLHEQLRRVIGDWDPARVVHSCGSGVSACHNLLAMEIAGLPGSRLFAPSWSGWIADPSHPIETGG